MVWWTTSTLASPIVSHCLTTVFLKFLIVWPKAVFVSSWINVEKVVKHVVDLFYISFCLFNILDPSLRPLFLLFLNQLYHWCVFCSHFLSSFCCCTGCEPKEGANCVGLSKTRFRMVFLAGTAGYIGPTFHLDVVPW